MREIRRSFPVSVVSVPDSVVSVSVLYRDPLVITSRNCLASYANELLEIDVTMTGEELLRLISDRIKLQTMNRKLKYYESAENFVCTEFLQ